MSVTPVNTKVEKVVCHHCNKSIKKIGAFHFDGVFYCKKCKEELFFVCNRCCEYGLKQEEVNMSDDSVWCQDCYDEHGFSCAECDNKYHSDYECFSERDGEGYCEECYRERFVTCRNCSYELYRDEPDEIHESPDNGELYCETCYNELHRTCIHCGESRGIASIYIVNGELNYCSPCYTSLGLNGRRLFNLPTPPTPPHLSMAGTSNTRCDLIHDYSYRPESSFKKMKWENTLFLGIELEVEHKSDLNLVTPKFVEFLKREKIEDTFYLKRDGSLQNGFEIVSQPFTLKWAHREMKLKHMLEYLEREKFSSYENGRCGLHIHISDEFFEEMDKTKLRFFFSKNKEKLYKFSCREGVGNNFCEFERLNQRNFIDGNLSSGRYWALNFNTNKPTIEIRMFRGTLKFDKLLACLQFSDAISWFIKGVGITSMIYGDGIYKDNSWKLFIDWCRQEKKYKHLLKTLRKENLICA